MGRKLNLIVIAEFFLEREFCFYTKFSGVPSYDRIPETEEHLLYSVVLDDYAIMFALDLGIVTSAINYHDNNHGRSGFEPPADQLFRPNDLVTREEAAIMVQRTYNVIEYINNNPYGTKTFTNYTNMYTEYGEGDYIYHQDLWDYAQASSNTATANYNDASQISNWAMSGVGFCQEEGILEGSDGNFNPKGNMTIEQAIVMISRIDTGTAGTSMKSTDLDYVMFANDEARKQFAEVNLEYLYSQYQSTMDCGAIVPEDYHYTTDSSGATFTAFGSSEPRPQYANWYYNGGSRAPQY